MNISDADSKWNKFERTGRIADYLSYKGVISENVTDSDRTYNNRGSGAERTIFGQQRQIH